VQIAGLRSAEELSKESPQGLIPDEKVAP
jgi:hypothetical protein